MCYDHDKCLRSYDFVNATHIFITLKSWKKLISPCILRAHNKDIAYLSISEQFRTPKTLESTGQWHSLMQNPPTFKI